jgi:hypothetical protein
MSETPKHHRLRFSLKLLLVIMTLVAAYLAGRWNGYQEGRKNAFSDDWLMLTVRNQGADN